MVHSIRSLSQFLEHFPVVAKVFVHWGEMDSFRHVNNVNYFRYIETGRILHMHAMLDSLAESDNKYGEDFLNGRGIGPIISETSIRYKYPVKFPETILIGAAINPTESTEGKFIQRYSIWGIGPKRVVAEGQANILAYDYENNRKATHFPNCIVESYGRLHTKNSLHMLPDLTHEFKL